MQGPNNKLNFFGKKDIYIDPQGKTLRIFKPSKPLMYSLAGAFSLLFLYAIKQSISSDLVFELRPQPSCPGNPLASADKS